jgi:hypothetical protein
MSKNENLKYFLENTIFLAIVTDIVRKYFHLIFFCDYIFFPKKLKNIFYRNRMEQMEQKIEQIEQFLSNEYYCVDCDYITKRKLNYDRHILTARHQKRANGANVEQKIEQIEQQINFTCICGNVYKYKRNLNKHKTKCYEMVSKEQITPELVLKIIEQNKELTNVILEQNKTINKLCNNNVTNNTLINNHNSNNKSFNLNVYLNETCKNAINIDEFVKNIKLSLDDLEYTGRNGYSEGISNIILKNLKKLGEYDRPIHCADHKREVLYIKYNNVWNKEEHNKPILTNAIKVIANENIKQISKWREKNPDCIHADSKKNNLYLKIVSNSMCGIDKEETDKNMNKIMSNVIKEVVIDKHRNA